MPVSRRFIQPDPATSSPLRAVHSLREAHVRSLANDLSRLPGTWTLDRHESYDGDLTVMVTLHQGRENLVVSHQRDGFHLGANREDSYRELGRFSTMDALVMAIGSRSAAQAAMTRTA